MSALGSRGPTRNGRDRERTAEVIDITSRRRRPPEVLQCTAPDELLTVDQVLAELHVPRRTWQRWRQLGVAPACLRLPNRELRVRRSVLTQWLNSREELGEAA
jgi:hypothetical protein